ncbi:MAG TPA: VWA domain-containing protein [Parafilimonas sp.]|nr:VWA domain-containing protein [Parafilimonas sp.]
MNYLQQLKDIITHIDWQQFHFLRPKALYLFIPLAVIVLLLLLGNKERRKWKTMIDASLRKYMFTRGSRWAIILPLLAFIIAMSCVILGVAGPTWKKKDIPGEKIQAVVLIALDLSRSMLAEDIQPDRLERAKFKISDFLDANPRARAGLLAFAGTAHPVIPFTSDYKLVEFQAKALENKIMPVQGSNIPVLIAVMDSVMKQIDAPSTILLMTDAIDTEDATLLSNWINSTRHHLEILLFSTPNGAPIPGFAKVISKQDPTVSANLAQDTSISITPITLDKSDVQGIAKRISGKLIFEKEKKQDEKDWDDMGWLLIIPALIITAFWFRRGWVIQWCWVPLISLSLTSCGVNSKHPDWWYNKDYQGQLWENAGKYAEAADAFEDDQHKAVAYFKAGNYAAAADLFALDTTSSGNYNRGLALAKLGRFDDAEAAFNKAIDLDPSLKDAAGKSIAAVKQSKQQADSVLKYNPTSVSKNAKDLAEQKKQPKKDSLKTHKPQGKDEQLSADTRVKELPKFGERAMDEVASNIHTAKESKQPDKNLKADKNDQLASNILLRRAEADPSEFLHKRFELQEKRYYKNIKKSKNPW